MQIFIRVIYIIDLRHRVANTLEWNMCQKYGYFITAKSYEHFIAKELTVLENEQVMGISMQTETKIRPKQTCPRATRYKKNMLHY